MNDDKLFFRGDNVVKTGALVNLPDPPPWREFEDSTNRMHRGATYQATRKEIEIINAALYLRRPVLITGKPGVGKSSLAFAVAHELNLGSVEIWPITSKSVLQDGLYSYDAIGRLQEASLQRGQNESGEDIGRYIRLGPVGSALLRSEKKKPAVVLIDEIDKSDIDLPNDLLHLFEEGEFTIQELARLPKGEADQEEDVKVFTHEGQSKIAVPRNGHVRCQAFPLVILTSNGEREFPPAFLRRCLRITVENPNKDVLAGIIDAHLGKMSDKSEVKMVIDEFMSIRDEKQQEIATDQLLNAVYLLTKDIDVNAHQNLREVILKALGNT